jgi:hypothetical protein
MQLPASPGAARRERIRAMRLCQPLRAVSNGKKTGRPLHAATPRASSLSPPAGATTAWRAKLPTPLRRYLRSAGRGYLRRSNAKKGRIHAVLRGYPRKSRARPQPMPCTVSTCRRDLCNSRDRQCRSLSIQAGFLKPRTQLFCRGSKLVPPVPVVLVGIAAMVDLHQERPRIPAALPKCR